MKSLNLKLFRTILSIVFSAVSVSLMAWDFWPLPMAEPDTMHDELHYGFEALTVMSSGSNSPFWLHSNTNAFVSAQPFSGSMSAMVCKPATRPARWYDYDFKVELAGRFDDRKQTGFFRELYAHARLYVFDITVGIKPLIYGSQMTSLSSGGMLFSGNAQPIPRITVGIDRYTAFPGLYGYVEVRGGLTHGWFVDKNSLDNIAEVANTLLHHKFGGIRFGGKLPVNLSYEFHHVAQWGGTSPVYGDMGSSWQSFKNIFFFRSGGNNISDQLNAEGNHIGWQELALTANYGGWHAVLYWQAVFEDKSGAFIGTGMNVADGLWGINLTQDKWPFINALTYEFLNTTNQDGPYHDKDGMVYGGMDGYFANSIYKQGWTHFHQSIGTPLIYAGNNRVRTHFAGISGDVFGYKYRLLSSYTRNWGTYFVPSRSTNTGLMLEVKKQVEKAWGLEFGVTVAADFGSQYCNCFGAMISVAKKGLILRY